MSSQACMVLNRFGRLRVCRPTPRSRSLFLSHANIACIDLSKWGAAFAYTRKRVMSKCWETIHQRHVPEYYRSNYHCPIHRSTSRDD